MLQERLVKEMRLLGISTMATANAYVPVFIVDFNRRFGKPPRNDFDANRSIRADEDLDPIFTVREPRHVSNSLTLQYDKTIYLLRDTPQTRVVMGKDVEVYEYADGHIEVRANGAALPYSTHDRLSEVDQGAIVDNKRLGHVLQVAQLVQEQRDSRRGRSAPARTNTRQDPVQLKSAIGKKPQRKLDANDLKLAIRQTKRLSARA